MEVKQGPGSQAVRVEIGDKVAQIVLERSFRRNAMDQDLVDGIKNGLLDLARNPDIAAIVLHGAAPGFCAGSDLKFISKMNIDALSRFEQECGDLGRLIGFIDKPVIAAVEGFAIGGGFTLATCCDLVVAASDSKWSLPEVPIGWLTPWGINSIVARAGYVAARKLSLGLDTLDGNEAHRQGLVDYVTDPGSAVAFALNLGGRIGDLPAPAVAATKRFFSSYVMDKAEAMDFEANRLFSQNALEAEAQKTFARFRKASAPEQPDV